MVASLATVLVDRLRHDMIKSSGVPYGLAGAISLFSQSSYFWSTTFLVSLSKRTWLNKELLVLILVSGFLAATAGPAVAVLLIPREHTWPAGGTTFWLNGTSDATFGQIESGWSITCQMLISVPTVLYVIHLGLTRTRCAQPAATCRFYNASPTGISGKDAQGLEKEIGLQLTYSAQAVGLSSRPYPFIHN
jgi:hypothetical protein